MRWPCEEDEGNDDEWKQSSVRERGGGGRINAASKMENVRGKEQVIAPGEATGCF